MLEPETDPRSICPIGQKEGFSVIKDIFLIREQGHEQIGFDSSALITFLR